MKTLFEYSVLKKVETEETIITQEDGKDVKTIKMIEKEIPLKIALKKPTRELTDASKLFYAVKISEAVTAGIMNEVLLQKRLANDGGSLSEGEKREFGDLYLNLFEKQKEYYELDAKSFDDLNDKEKESKKVLQSEIGALSQKVAVFQSSHSSIFENTAEAYARNHTMRWFILNLLYQEKIDDKGNTKGEFAPLFGAGDYNSKLKIYDDLEEKSEDFYLKVIRKGANLVSYYYIGQASTPEDFKKLAESYDSELASNEV